MKWETVIKVVEQADCDTEQAKQAIVEIRSEAPDGSFNCVQKPQDIAAAIVWSLNDEMTRREAINAIGVSLMRDGDVSRGKSHIQKRIGQATFEEIFDADEE